MWRHFACQIQIPWDQPGQLVGWKQWKIYAGAIEAPVRRWKRKSLIISSHLSSSLLQSSPVLRRKRIKAQKPIPSDPARRLAMVSLQFWGWIGWIGLCCVPALGKSGKGGRGGKQLKISYRFAQLTDVHIEPFYNPELLSWNYRRFWLLQCVQIGVGRLGRLGKSSWNNFETIFGTLGMDSWHHPFRWTQKLLLEYNWCKIFAIAEVKVIVSCFHTTCLNEKWWLALVPILFNVQSAPFLFIAWVDVVQVGKKVSWGMVISGLPRSGHLKGDVCRIPEAFNKSSCCFARKCWQMLARFRVFHVSLVRSQFNSFLESCNVSFKVYLSRLNQKLNHIPLGRLNCDPPVALLRSVMEHMARVANENKKGMGRPEFVIFTGDIPSHQLSCQYHQGPDHWAGR